MPLLNQWRCRTSLNNKFSRNAECSLDHRARESQANRAQNQTACAHVFAKDGPRTLWCRFYGKSQYFKKLDQLVPFAGFSVCWCDRDVNDSLVETLLSRGSLWLDRWCVFFTFFRTTLAFRETVLRRFRNLKRKEWLNGQRKRKEILEGREGVPCWL